MLEIKFKQLLKIVVYFSKKVYFCGQNGPVVQLYRTSDSGSEGQGLESLRGHKEKDSPFR